MTFKAMLKASSVVYLKVTGAQRAGIISSAGPNAAYMRVTKRQVLNLLESGMRLEISFGGTGGTAAYVNTVEPDSVKKRGGMSPCGQTC